MLLLPVSDSIFQKLSQKENLLSPISASGVKMVFALSTKVVNFYLAVFIIKFRVSSVEKSFADIFLLRKKSLGQYKSLIVLQIGFYKTIEQSALGV